MATPQELYAELIDRLRRTALLGSCGSLLGWDEQTHLPPEGAEHRAEQLALLAGMTHEWATHPRIGELLGELESRRSGEEPDDGDVQVNVREARQAYDRVVRLPRRLVEELSRTTTLAQQNWVEARRKSDFRLFLPWLERVIELKREQSSVLSSTGAHPYDALLDEYEPGATAASIGAVFEPLRAELVPLVAAIRDSGITPPREILTREYPVDAQREFATAAAKAIGFNFEAGRLDVAAHPFCSGIGPGDCRLTTRYDSHHFPGAFFGTLHEAGHGIYEQGLSRTAFGTPLGQTVSLGIHESQSRMWENLVGRGRAFWKHFFPLAQQAFPGALKDTSCEDFHRAVNDVRASLIRVEADEVTYNLHIMLRFELEQALITRELPVADLPGVWDDTFERYFGIRPESVAAGCLQDIHWSAGLFGYFPTYALGNMYAVQFFEAADRDLGGLDEQFASGRFQPLREWLNAKIHQPGMRYRAQELVHVVTGQSLSHVPLMRHLRERFGPLYGLS